MAREEAEGTVAWGDSSGDDGSGRGRFPFLGLGRENISWCGGAFAALRAPDADGRVGGGGEDPVGRRVDGDILDGGFVAEELGNGDDGIV